jgi:3-dehydroquinate synthase
VLVERGLLDCAAKELRGLLPVHARLFVLTQPPVRKHWLGRLKSFAKTRLEVLEMPDGERNKTLARMEKLAEEMVRRGADRHSVLLALGGGVVGDVGGFLASVFMRGIPVVQIPTTLLAQVDSAIGGKTGVNLRSGKNLLGTFHQPAVVLADPQMLTTLPDREYRSGLYEAMKYGVIRDPAIFELMEKRGDALLRRDEPLLEKLIAACVQVKADVVRADERESGERRILNFGHTIGHALEAETGYKHFFHGEAVAWGMIAATRLAESMGMLDSSNAARIIAMVQSYGRLPIVDVGGKKILRRLLTDKKTIAGVPHFVLPSAIGKVEIVNTVTERDVLRVLKELKQLSKA